MRYTRHCVVYNTILEVYATKLSGIQTLAELFNRRNMIFKRFNEVSSIQLNNFFVISNESKDKFERRKSTNNFHFFLIDSVIQGYFFTYEYEKKFKFLFYFIKQIKKDDLLILSNFLNDKILTKTIRNFYIIEESKNSYPILENFKFIDASLMYVLTKKATNNDVKINSKFEIQQEIIPQDEYIELLKKCFWNDEIWDYSNYKEYINNYDTDDSVITISCRKNDKLIGAVSAVIEGESLYIDFIVTHPDYQKQGIAKKLFSNLINHVNYQEVILDVKIKNEPARSFYEKLGFCMIKVSYIVVKKLVVKE
ncbi:GNAT family N-acetyltransferase [bacterium]|nr:MAG: GNAT family N-acetyltransferase [bacterium]